MQEGQYFGHPTNFSRQIHPRRCFCAIFVYDTIQQPESTSGSNIFQPRSLNQILYCDTVNLEDMAHMFPSLRHEWITSKQSLVIDGGKGQWHWHESR